MPPESNDQTKLINWLEAFESKQELEWSLDDTGCRICYVSTPSGDMATVLVSAESDRATFVLVKYLGLERRVTFSGNNPKFKQVSLNDLTLQAVYILATREKRLLALTV